MASQKVGWTSAAGRHKRGKGKRIYQTLCLTLAGQSDRMSWPAFSPADWDRLIATARAEGVAPLLYQALEEGEGKGEKGKGKEDSILHSPSLRPGSGQASNLHPPSSVLHELRTAYYSTAAHNLLLYHELARILDAFTNSLTIQPSSHPAILLKGAALATTLYPTPALRPLSDIDLLIPRQHLEPAVQAMKSLGYRQPYPEMTAVNLPIYRKLTRILNAIRNPQSEISSLKSEIPVAGHHTHLRGGPHQSIIVELHWNLVGSDTDWRTPPMDWFWEQTEEWKGENGEGKMEGGFHPPPSTLHFPISNLQSPFSNSPPSPTSSTSLPT